MSQIIETEEHPYVALIPFDSNLAPLVASAEFTRNYITAERLFRRYMAAAYDTKDDKGRLIINIPPDAKFWFSKMIEINKEAAKLNMVAGIKEVETSLNIFKMILEEKDLLTQDQRKEITKKLIEKMKNQNVPQQ